MKDPVSIASPNPSSAAEMFANENDLDELQGTGTKRIIISLLQEFKELKENTKKQLGEIKEKAQGEQTPDGNDKDDPRCENRIQEGGSNTEED